MRTVIVSITFLNVLQFADFAVMLFSRTKVQPRNRENKVTAKKRVYSSLYLNICDFMSYVPLKSVFLTYPCFGEKMKGINNFYFKVSIKNHSKIICIHILLLKSKIHISVFFKTLLPHKGPKCAKN